MCWSSSFSSPSLLRVLFIYYKAFIVTSSECLVNCAHTFKHVCTVVASRLLTIDMIRSCTVGAVFHGLFFMTLWGHFCFLKLWKYPLSFCKLQNRDNINRTTVPVLPHVLHMLLYISLVIHLWCHVFLRSTGLVFYRWKHFSCSSPQALAWSFKIIQILSRVEIDHWSSVQLQIIFKSISVHKRINK